MFASTCAGLLHVISIDILYFKLVLYGDYLTHCKPDNIVSTQIAISCVVGSASVVARS
jgi:hypothetical protein